MVYIYIWQYDIYPDFRSDFLFSYGPTGERVKFFKKGDGYLKTELLTDKQNKFKFITIDYWINSQQYAEFLKKNELEFTEIDKKCDAFTKSELKIGDYELVGDLK
jgi:hypothetical protein